MQRTERNSNRDASAAVKRVWHLWEAVIERGNFVATFHEAARGKRRKLAARACARDLCDPPAEIPTKLEAGTFGTGRFTLRKVHNQKERTIYAPAFVEQVFHHVLMNVGDSDLERHEIHQSYACLRSQGRLAAVAPASHAWPRKLDISNYFDSLPHMDDFVFWTDDKAALTWTERSIDAFEEKLPRLVLKYPPCPQRRARGMDYLGERIFTGFSETNRRKRVRYWRRLSLPGSLNEEGSMPEREAKQRLTATTAFLLPNRSRRSWWRVMSTSRSEVIGHGPGESGQQLQQQRDHCALREPQQQRLPSCPQLKLAEPEGAAISTRGLNLPLSCMAGEIPANEPAADTALKAPSAPFSETPGSPSAPLGPDIFPHALQS